MDQTIVQRTKAVGVDRQPFGDTRAKTLDRNVGRSCKFVHERRVPSPISC